MYSANPHPTPTDRNTAATPTLEAQRRRFTDCGWHRSEAFSMDHVYRWVCGWVGVHRRAGGWVCDCRCAQLWLDLGPTYPITPPLTHMHTCSHLPFSRCTSRCIDPADRRRIERLEIFDEFEEWHLIQVFHKWRIRIFGTRCRAAPALLISTHCHNPTHPCPTPLSPRAATLLHRAGDKGQHCPAAALWPSAVCSDGGGSGAVCGPWWWCAGRRPAARAAICWLMSPARPSLCHAIPVAC